MLTTEIEKLMCVASGALLGFKVLTLERFAFSILFENINLGSLIRCSST